MTATALAGELGLPLFSIQLDALITKYMGETAAKLRLVFETIQSTRGVYFFDEFDAIGKERGDTHETGEIKRVVSSLLMQIDDLPENVIVNPRESSLDHHPLYLSHSAQKLVLKAGEPGKQSLYLILLANKQSEHLLTDGYEIGDVFWAADDSTIAFIRYDRVEKHDVLHILSADGHTEQQFALPSDSNNVLLGWTWCP